MIDEKCPVCGWKLQKRACGLVCKNWNCYKCWRCGETIEEMWRREGLLGRCWVGNRLWFIASTEIREIKEGDEDW